MFRTVSSVHHQQFFTVHTAMVYVIQVIVTACEQDQGGSAVPSWSCSQAVSKPVWHKPLLCVQWKIPDDGQRNCPKHVEFYSENEFENLVHLVGLITRINFKSQKVKQKPTYLTYKPLKCLSLKQKAIRTIEKI